MNTPDPDRILAGSYQIILKQVGSLIAILGLIISIPALVAVVYGEWYSLIGFVISSIIVSLTGLRIYKTFKNAVDPHTNHVLVITAAGWLAVTLAGGLPFFIIAWITPPEVMNAFIPAGVDYQTSSLLYFRDYLNCFFESMSAFTTTGLTMAIHEPSVGKAVLFYRSLANWFGGIGFIIVALALFRKAAGKGANLLFSAESTSKKFKPRIIETTKSIWKVYIIISIVSFLYLLVGTLIILPEYGFSNSLFDSLCHAMSGQSTGGFSTLDDSIAGYQSKQMNILYIFPMIIGSFSMPFFFKVIIEGKISEVWNDIQTKWLIIAFIAGSIIQVLILSFHSLITDPVIGGVFQFISGMSTTGWQTQNLKEWDWLSIAFISICGMYIGGASGGTVGGIKMIRAIFILKGFKWQVGKTFQSDSTIKTLKFDGRNMHETEINEEFSKAATIALLSLLLITISAIFTFYLTGDQFTFKDAVLESVSAQSTVGFSSGITDPSMPSVLKSIYIFQMWTGRLEIIPVLAFLRALLMGTRPVKL